VSTAINHNNNHNPVFFKNINHNLNHNSKYEEARRIERITGQLVDKFQNPDGEDFYRCVAKKLAESRIWYNYELATRPNKGIRHPGRYFTYLCKVDGV
jgi:hypothetical protein